MFKSMFLNRKKVPVPVPIRNLAEAVDWIETYLLSEDKAITKIELDGELIEDLRINRPLSETSRLFVQIDSPMELSVQTIDALRNLTNLMGKDVKSFAVTAWQSKPHKPPLFVNDFIDDLNLILDMLDHVALLINGNCETSNLRNYGNSLQKILSKLTLARSHSDWRSFARIMVKELEEILYELNQEMRSLQNQVFAIQAEKSIAKTGSNRR